jgi:hypothetical protein
VKPRTKTALVMNCVVGIPVIVALSAWNASTHFANPAETALTNAALGFTVSLVFVWVSLRGFVERWIRAT